MVSVSNSLDDTQHAMHHPLDSSSQKKTLSCSFMFNNDLFCDAPSETSTKNAKEHAKVSYQHALREKYALHSIMVLPPQRKRYGH